MPDRPDRPDRSDRPARPADRPGDRTGAVRPAAGGAPGPLVAVCAIALDPAGRVIVAEAADAAGAQPRLPGGLVTGSETPEQGLARILEEELGPGVPHVGRLLVVDAQPAAGAGGRACVVHVHLVAPLPPESSAGVRRRTPQEAYEVLPKRDEARLRAGLAALNAGTVAHLIDGFPHTGSPVGLDPVHRAMLEHAGALDAASHRAVRPKALTAASVVFTDTAGRVLLVEPAYGRPGRWNLPGGGIDGDLGETPREAARREVREELGLDLEPGRLLGVNWSHKPGHPARIRFLYDGGVLAPDTLAEIRLSPVELLRWRAAAPAELRGLVKPALRRQIKACLRARHRGTGPLELHAGRPVPVLRAGGEGGAGP
ncbi:NUDIX domain-containing protein [Streptomyces sp. NPDC046866]|uniref:NUDIX hydrolase n=1 Tax=Streptomyces sp. NPDC046866 TaxID=3154921 RepID=UPI00345655F3